MTKEQTVKVKADVTKLKQQTSAAYRAIQQHLEEQEQRHLASIDEYYQQAQMALAETLDTQKTLEATIHNIQLYGQYLSKGSAYDLTTNVRSLVKRSEEELSKSIPELRLKVDLTWSDWEVKGEVDRVRLVREGEGNVKNGQKWQQMSTATGQSVARCNHGVRQLNTFTTHCNEEVRGMVAYHNHVFVVHYGHAKLYVYDNEGMLERSVWIHNWIFWQLRHPLGMCLVQGEGDTRNLVISDCVGRCLWWLTIEKQADAIILGRPQYHKLGYKPFGISTDRSGRAVVAS